MHHLGLLNLLVSPFSSQNSCFALYYGVVHDNQDWLTTTKQEKNCLAKKRKFGNMKMDGQVWGGLKANNSDIHHVCSRNVVPGSIMSFLEVSVVNNNNVG